MKINGNIIAVDAGFRNMGVVVYSSRQKTYIHSRVYSTGRNAGVNYVAEDYRIRLEFLCERLATIIGEFKPVFVVAELPVGSSKSSRAASQMAFAFAVVVIVCKLLNVRLKTITPKEIKQFVAPQSKKVEKAEVIQFVVARGYGRLLPNTKSRQEHVADAIACLECYFNKQATP